MNYSGVISQSSKVAPVPYMTERCAPGRTSVQADNMPRPALEQELAMEASYGGQLPIDTTYSTWPRRAQQFEKFKAFVATQILPTIRRESGWDAAPVDDFRTALDSALPETMDPSEHGMPIAFSWAGGSYATGTEFSRVEYEDFDAPEVSIAVVGHGEMMLEYCLEGISPKPNNNAVFEKLFVLEASSDGGATTSTTLRELAGRCAMVMDAPPLADFTDGLTEADVASCTSPFDVSDFIELESASGNGSLQGTACTRIAEAEGAYPIQPDYIQHGSGGEL